MKERPILSIAIVITLLVEVVIMVLVYTRVGADRLPMQISRLIFQLICIFMILANRSKTALFVLTAFHIVSALLMGYSKVSSEFIGQFLMVFHFVIGMVIYFHDWLEEKLQLNMKT